MIIFADALLTTQDFNERFALYGWDSIDSPDENHVVLTKNDGRVILTADVVDKRQLASGKINYIVHVVSSVDGVTIFDKTNDYGIYSYIYTMMQFSYGISVDPIFQQYLDDYQAFLSTNDPDTKLTIYLSASDRLHSSKMWNELLTVLASSNLYGENAYILTNNMATLYAVQTGRPYISPENRWAFVYRRITSDNVSDIAAEMNRDVPLDISKERLIGMFLGSAESWMKGGIEISSLAVPITSIEQDVHIVTKGSRGNKWVVHKKMLYVSDDNGYVMMMQPHKLHDHLMMQHSPVNTPSLVERLPSSLATMKLA
jgi:hypothetical protein